MNTLWASLIGLILIALAVVLAFNLLQGRQTRLRDAWREKLAGGRRAPDGTTPPGPARTEPPPPPPSAIRVEPTFGPAADADDADAGPSAAGDAADAPLRGDGSAPSDARRQVHWSETPDAPRPPAASGVASSGPGAASPGHGGPSTGPGAVSPGPDGPSPGQGARAAAATGASPSSAPTPPAAAAPAEAVDATGPVLDPRLDCIVGLPLAAPVAADRVLAAASALRRAGSKPVAVEVDVGDGRWSVPHASQRAMRRVRAGVLLANRHGPLNAMEFSEFVAAIQGFGRAIGAGGADPPGMAPVLDHARQLDEACAQLDAVIGLNVETPTALSPDELAALAGGLGLQERGNNRFTAMGEDGAPLFSLALGERAEQLTLVLDLPRAPEHAQPWQRMVATARACAERTGGRVVDDAGRPLTDAAAAGVDRQLAMRYRSLAQAGLDAGSAPALRVFN